VGRNALLIATLLTASLPLWGCGPKPQPVPPSDTCLMPTFQGVDTLLLGAGNPADLSGAMSPFQPLHDGDAVSVIRGGQGATMVGFTLEVSGAAPPTCLGQQLTITGTDGTYVTESSTPVTTYGQADGSRVTHAIWLPASYPATFVVEAQVGAQMVTLHLHQ